MSEKKSTIENVRSRMKNSQWRTEDESSLRDGRWTDKKEEKGSLRKEEEPEG